MKIGIFTLPLNENYGGILQAYALQTYLQKLGHNVWLIEHKHKHSEIITFFLNLKRLFQLKMQGNKKVIPFLEQKRKITDVRIDEFKTKYFTQVTENLVVKGSDSISKYDFDLVFVGSDQVWRKDYVEKDLLKYFLDFVPDSVIKISYAASFGIDEWQFSKIVTEQIKLLLSRFEGVSVREDSAVELLKNYVDIAADHVIDPTMLLHVEDYKLLINKSAILNKKFTGEIFTYILDLNLDKQEFISTVEERLSLNSFTVFNEKYNKINTCDPKDAVMPSIEEWLKAFDKAEYVLTDSFHGCVFSLLFNKPFIVYVNIERGATRFRSLLKIFGLEKRLITSKEECSDYLLEEPIDWVNVNQKIQSEREKASAFLEDYINEI